MFRNAKWKLTAFELSSPIVQQLTKDVAVVAYKVHEELLVDGKQVVLDAAALSTWVRGADGWLCAAHAESIAGDPFGRDRHV